MAYRVPSGAASLSSKLSLRSVPGTLDPTQHEPLHRQEIHPEEMKFRTSNVFRSALVKWNVWARIDPRAPPVMMRI
ncbi:MAG: hypothetical protein WBW90_01830 [Candidatus Acidiferrum sp.]